MSTRGQWWLRATAAVIGMLGIPIVWMGAQLVIEGGTTYYLATGILFSLSAFELWQHRRRGFFLFTAALLLTLTWAVYEAGNSFWLVGVRIWLVGVIWLWLCSPVIRRPLWGESMPTLLSMRIVQVSGVFSILVLAAMTFNLLKDDVLFTPISNHSVGQTSSDWSAYGANPAGTRYVPHAQINTKNVSNLVQVWQAPTSRIGRFSGTPIQIGDGLYLCTSQNVVISLDPDTGVERWRHDPENNTPPFDIFGNCRGVTYYHVPTYDKGEHCAERIYTATTDARMIALDMATGKPCEEFGETGEISLLAGMGEVKPLHYFVSSPPTVASGVLVVGGFVLDNRETDEPSGVVRGYDPRTGLLIWAWDIGRESDVAIPPDGGDYTRGTPNVWSLMSADNDLGLVYVPTGNATPDYFGGHRSDVMDKFASSIVALDAKTGVTRWHFQTTHHDIWDYDVPSQPTLVDLTLEGVRRKAVIVPTKRGELFVLDRETGEIITEVSEREVPQTDIAGERSSPTQPFSIGMPSFAHPRIREQDLFGISPFDQIACRAAFNRLRYEGPMTPPSTQGTLLYPGPAGGMNWGGVAVDEKRQLLVVNTMHLPFIVRMISREKDLVETREGIARGYGIGGPQKGTPFAAHVEMFLSPLGMPCLKPPYGEIAVVDLISQRIVWRRGMGLLKLGFPSTVGTFITAGGLIFNAVADAQLRAIDALNGNVIWQGQLPAASGATPMSYVSPKTGRQYVLVTVPGKTLPEGDIRSPVNSEGVGSPEAGGQLIAFALKEGLDA